MLWGGGGGGGGGGVDLCSPLFLKKRCMQGNSWFPAVTSMAAL